MQRSTITIPLGLGVNTKTDEKLVEAGAFNLVCENASFDKVGAVKKRQGYGVYSSTIFQTFGAPNTSINISSLSFKPVTAAAIGSQIFLKNSLGNYYYSHEGNFVQGDSDPIPEASVSSVPILSTKTSIDSQDCDYDQYERILAVGARDGFIQSFGLGVGGTQFALYDIDAKTSVMPSYVSDALGSNRFGFVRAGFTRVSGVSYYHHCFVNSDNILSINTFNKYAQTLASFTQANILADGVTTATKGPISAARSSNDQTYFFIVPTTTAATGRFIAISGTTITFNTTFAHVGTGWKSSTACFNSSASRVHFSYIQDSGVVNEIIFNPNGTVFAASVALAATSMLTCSYVQGDPFTLILNNATNCSKLFIPSSSLSIVNRFTQNVTDTFLINGNQTTFIIDNLDSNTYMSIGSTGLNSGASVNARLDTGTGLITVNQIGRAALISSSIAVAPLPRLSSDNGDYKTYTLQLTFLGIQPNYKSGSRSVIGPNLHMVGGIVTEFDGAKNLENGFLIQPKKPTLTGVSVGVLTGAYTYCSVLKYIDKKGQVTRSEPSQFTTITVATKIIDINLSITPFGLRARDCKVEIYRSLAGGSTLYFLREFSVDLYSFTSGIVTDATIPDNTLDSVISDNTQLYTTGNVLANNPAPASKFMTQGGNRIFLGGLEDENEIAYSKKKLFGESVSFSDFFRIRFDSSQFNIVGGVTAIGYMDDKFIAFKRNSIFFISGDGPNELGANDSFTQPELVSSETGCTDPRSVILTPTGLMFKGEKGIYLLGRGLNTQYIGSAVESYNSFNVNSAVHLDKKNQVIFTLSSGDVLVYDYFTQQWSVTTGFQCLDSDNLSGDHLILNASTNIPSIQNSIDFIDGITPYAVKIITPWIKVSGIQDYGRIWKAVIVGKYKTAHTLKVKVYYNYDETYSDSFDILPSVLDKTYQYSMSMIQQKCESMKFEIYDENIVGESMELTAITLEVGLKTGSYKLPATRKY